MKKSWVSGKRTAECIVVLLTACTGISISYSQDEDASPPNVPTPFITDRGPHSRTWSRISQHVAHDGRIIERTNVAYVELQTGMHFWDAEANTYRESLEQINIVDDAAVTTMLPHRVRFAADFASAAPIDLTTPDQKRIRFRVMGLAYASRATGASVLIAEPKSSIGEVLGQTQVIYRSAFDGPFRASAVYTCTRSGLRQDLVFGTRPPAPESVGIPSDVAVLEIWTAVLDPIDPLRTPVVLERESDLDRRAAFADPDLIDETLDFGGGMIMPLGAAFLTENELNEDERHLVAKNWVIAPDGARYLVERLSYAAIREQLQQLPPENAALAPKPARQAAAALAKQANVSDAVGPVRIQRSFPVFARAREIPASTQPVRMAMTDRPERGFVCDFTLTGSLTNYTLRSDETYYVAAGTTVNFYGTLRIEPATVVKMGQGTSRLLVYGDMETLGSDFRPSFVVAKDDDSIGSVISGSTGAPGSAWYPTRAIELNSATSTFNLQHLHFRNCERVLQLTSGTLMLSHSTVIRSRILLATSKTTGITRFQNILGAELSTAILGNPGCTNIFENATLHNVGTFNLHTNNLLTNCVLIGVTNLPFKGAYNYSNLVDPGIFTTVGAAAHYLSSDSYRDGGTAAIDPTLLSALRRRTTRAPIVIENSNLLSYSLTNFVARDDGAVDQGFHYAALDAVLHNCIISNVTVTARPGIALGVRGGVGTFGLRLDDNGSLNLSGYATNLAIVARYNLVQ